MPHCWRARSASCIACTKKKQLIDHLQQSGVSLFVDSGPARFVDPHTIASQNGRRLQAEKFVLCVGGHARRLGFPGADLALTHSDVWSLQALPESVVIVGAAATGCQLASILDTFGARVTLLDRASRILAGEDETVSAAMQAAFERRKIEIITGIEGLERIEWLPDTDDRQSSAVAALRLYYTRDEIAQSLDAEAVILAVGWPGNLEALNLGAAGVQTERSYIPVDEHLRTSAGHIFAAGDITGRMMLVQSGSYEARIAAENAVSGTLRRYEHRIVPHGGFTDPEYGSVGMTEAQARAEHDVTVAVVPYTELDRPVIDGRTEGFCKLIVSRETHRILGAHVVGEQALEVVHLVAAGMAADMRVEYLADLEIAYPTFTASVGLAARQILRELGVLPLTTQWRALGRLRGAEWERSTG